MCQVMLHESTVIKSFKSKALKLYWTKGDASKLPSEQVGRISRALSFLDVAIAPEEMDRPGYRFHELKGDRAGTYSVTVSANWRLTFRFEGEDAIVLDHEDYH